MSRFQPSLLLGLLLTAAAPSYAEDTDVAEVERLRAEMQGLAERAAWAGVERAYVALTEIEGDESYNDHFLGAQAAKALGDVSSVRVRLLSANAVEENQDVMDWLFAIDSNFGEVELKSAPGTAELEAAKMPFASDERAAVERAKVAVAEEGVFAGYLPTGGYTFGGQPLQVLPRVPTTVVDLTRRSGPDDSMAHTPPAAGKASDNTAKAPRPKGDAPGTWTMLAGGGTSFGWMGAAGVGHFGPAGVRLAVGYDTKFSIPSAQLGARGYPAGFTVAGPAAIAPFAELSLAPLRWKETGRALYGPALSMGVEALLGGFAVDFQLGGGVTRDQVREATRPGLIIGLGVGYNFG